MLCARKTEWVEDDYRYWGKCVADTKRTVPIFIATALNFWSLHLRQHLYQQVGKSNTKTVYTVFSSLPKGFQGPLFEAQEKPGYHFIDLWNRESILNQQQNGLEYLTIQLDAFDKNILAPITKALFVPSLNCHSFYKQPWKGINFNHSNKRQQY